MKNRNQLIEVFVSNLSNAIIHQVLERAANKQIYAEGYNKEFRNSWQIAKNYREKINPLDKSLPFHDTNKIREKIIKKVNSELKLRIDRGYENINLDLVPNFVDKSLKDLNVI